MLNPIKFDYGEFTIKTPWGDHSDKEIWDMAHKGYARIKELLQKGNYEIKSLTPIVHCGTIKQIEQEIEVQGWKIKRRLKVD